MQVIFTKYALDKFDLLAEHKLNLTQKQVEGTVNAPDRFDLELDPPKIIAIRDLDKKHNLHVVYLVEDDIIRVLSFYPAEKEIETKENIR